MIPIKGILENRLFFTFTMLINTSPSLRWRVFFSHYAFWQSSYLSAHYSSLQKCYHQFHKNTTVFTVKVNYHWMLQTVQELYLFMPVVVNTLCENWVALLLCCWENHKPAMLPVNAFVVYLICLYIPIVRTFTLFEQVQSVIELVMKLKAVRAFREKSTAMSPQQGHAHPT